MDDKIKLVFPEIEKTELNFNYTKEENGEKVVVAQIIKVNKYASLLDQRLIANYAIQTAEADTELDYNSLPIIEEDSKFEYGFIGGILQVMTNIDIQDIDIDVVVATGLWTKVKSAILNYHDLLGFVEKVSKDRKENLESKLNKIIDNVGKFVDNISKIDWSTENIQNMVKELGIGKEKLAEVFPNGVVGTPADAKKEKPKKSDKVAP